MSSGYYLSLLIVDNLNYYSKFYLVNKQQFCIENITEILKSYNSRILRYSCENICSDELLNSKRTVIFYMCTRWIECKRNFFQLKFKNFIKRFQLEKANLNFYKAEKFVIKRNFILTHFGTTLIDSEKEKIGLFYSGIHIRTYGYFHDFSENIKQTAKKFDIEGFRKKVIEFYDSLIIKTVYLSSDSIKMKNIIKNIDNSEVTLYFKNISSNHNRNFKKEIDDYTFIDLELLSIAKMALLTKGSTFSILVYMKNINCSLKTCFFYRGH